MTAEENKEILLRFLAELRKGNVAIVDEVCSEKFVFRSPANPGWPRGLEGARQLAKLVVEHPDYVDSQGKMDDIFAVDDKVVLRYSVFGTYVGEEKPGYPKKGERFAKGAIAIYRFVDGKIEDDWGVEEYARMLPGDEMCQSVAGKFMNPNLPIRFTEVFSSLAGLLCDNNRRDEASAILAEFY